MSRALTPQQKLGTIRDLLERSKPRLAEVLPKHLTAERLIRIALAAASRTPQLLSCTPQSLLLSVMHAAQLGLEAGGPLGSAYLVPFRNRNGAYEAQLIVGYRGLIDLARRSGEILKIEAHVVHEKDKFRCVFGMEPVLEHEPCWNGDPGVLVAAYAIAKLRDGSTQVEVMTRSQIDGIRNRSRAGKSGPWTTDYDEMARKTVVRRLAKYLPLTVEMSDALDLDSRAEMGDSATEILDVLPAEVKHEPPTTRNDEVRAALEERLAKTKDVVLVVEKQELEEQEFEEQEDNDAIRVARSHGKTARKIIESTWNLEVLSEMGQRENASKKRQKVLELIHEQIDLVRQAAKDEVEVEVEVEVKDEVKDEPDDSFDVEDDMQIGL